MSPSLRGSRFLAAVLICTMSFALNGCTESSNSGSQAVEKSSLPYFAFHKPKEIKIAVDRIRELHDAVTGSDPLPDPISYQVKEVIHGTGASGHSHFYLHDPAKAEQEELVADEADDGHVTTAENILDVKVNPIDEQKDLIRWLPKIASGGDMPESDWSKVNAISKEMTPKLYAIVEASTEEDKRRASYREHIDSFSSHISTLEELAK